MVKNNKNLLLFRLSAIGDVAISIRVLVEILELNKDLNFILVTDKIWENINFHNRLKIITFNKKKNGSFIGLINFFFKKLFKLDVIGVVDIHCVLRTYLWDLLFIFFLKKVYFINKQRTQRKKMTSFNNKKLVKLKPIYKTICEVISKFEINTDIEFKELIIKKKDFYNIGVAPFASYKSKQYPLDKLLSSLYLFNQKVKANFIFFCSNKEKKMLENKIYGKDNFKIGGVEAPLKNQIEEIRGLDFMISMDSANMHLASLVQIPTISIWNGTHPFSGFLGIGNKLEYAISKDLNCIPCSIFGTNNCFRNDFECHNIPENVIANYIEKILLN